MTHMLLSCSPLSRISSEGTAPELTKSDQPQQYTQLPGTRVPDVLSQHDGTGDVEDPEQGFVCVLDQHTTISLFWP